MKKTIRFLLFSLFLFIFCHLTSEEYSRIIPTAYNGRFIPLDAALRLQLQEMHGKQKLKKEKMDAFEFFLKLYAFGQKPFNDTPIFLVHYAKVKEALGLNPKETHFSYNTLNSAFLQNKTSDLNNFSSPYKEEGLALTFKLQHYKNLKRNKNKNYEKSFYELKRNFLSPQEIAFSLESTYPFAKRLKDSGTFFAVLPDKRHNWHSLDALNLKVYDKTTDSLQPIPNFTPYSDRVYKEIQKKYSDLQKTISSQDEHAISSAFEKLAETLDSAYSEIEGKPYREAFQKTLSYPSKAKLKAEFYYYKYPLITIGAIFYLIALIGLILTQKIDKKILNYLTFLFLSAAFLLHSAILAMRTFILNRPPVSNMFETVIYVPWIAMIAGFIFYLIGKKNIPNVSRKFGILTRKCLKFRSSEADGEAAQLNSWAMQPDLKLMATDEVKNQILNHVRYKLLLIASCFSSLLLLLLLQITGMQQSLENVQAVLDSNYWLTIHVLLIVGSYGLFFLCGLLGQIYLMSIFFKMSQEMKFLPTLILQTMYVGVFMLIPGTILGGVWAAESWGRFWDWDPKESWAFISSCIYLAVIHAYRFHKISAFGLSIGATLGLMAISFTWYGVNYILGTGLHSYGFGTGKNIYYYSFLLIQIFFLVIVSIKHKKRLELKNKNLL